MSITVKQIPPGICGIRIGDGFKIKYGRKDINTYIEAMQIYRDLLNKKDERAISWLIMASNMPGSEMKPIKIPPAIGFGCC